MEHYHPQKFPCPTSPLRSVSPVSFESPGSFLSFFPAHSWSQLATRERERERERERARERGEREREAPVKFEIAGGYPCHGNQGGRKACDGPLVHI